MKEKLTHFRIGQIVNTQGLKGEVRVYPYVDDINRFDDLESFYLDKNFEKEYEVEKVRYKGNMVIMKIKGIDSVELAEKVKTKNLYISRDNSVDLDEDEFFIADLIGLEVFTVGGDKVGILKDILQYSANDVYVVKGDNDKEYLIPSTLKFVPEINIEEKKMIIDPIKGMLD
ncbi:MAG TPA: 16S rRNA processing protein RimM [Terrisporobacter glycolicus]|uniref:Ribosome maturation factor RimM n=1 Tax=Terrisporobacter petrolearius TaxID=1460447 RepID=A0ABZ3FII1_9FIRM|nr:MULTISPECIES: ribosome maturation factor RimM [Terrisporobacter]HBI91669.1 16S rRNA processing protein RimM [Terrisporobacter hibernicus]